MARNRFLPKPLEGHQIFRDKDGRCVMSGHRAEFELKLHEALKMRAVLDAQWHCLNIWAMSGAAVDFALAKPEDFEPDYCGDPLEEGVFLTSEQKMDIEGFLIARVNRAGEIEQDWLPQFRRDAAALRALFRPPPKMKRAACGHFFCSSRLEACSSSAPSSRSVNLLRSFKPSPINPATPDRELHGFSGRAAHPTPGWTSCVGFALVFAIFISQTSLGRRLGKSIGSYITHNDRRIGFLRDMLNNVKSVKASTMEDLFQDKITAARNDELGVLRYYLTTSFAMFTAINQTTPYLAACASFLTYAMAASESQVNSKDSSDSSSAATTFDCASFEWPCQGDATPTSLQVGSLDIPRGKTTIVIGPNGSGKSSLLQSILGEMIISNGSCVVNGSVAYCSQDPWILSGDLGDSIVFNSTRGFDRQSFWQEEERARGAVRFSVLDFYIRQSGGTAHAVAVAFMTCMLTAAKVVSQYWFVWWIADTFSLAQSQYMGIFLGLTLFQGFVHRRGRDNARAPLWFFQQNPTGRILNRMSRDLDSMDSRLMNAIDRLLAAGTTMLASVTIVASYGVYLFGAVVPLLIIVGWCLQRFRVAARELQSLDSVLQSPALSIASESLRATSSARAYGAIPFLVRRHGRALDRLASSKNIPLLARHLVLLVLAQLTVHGVFPHVSASLALGTATTLARNVYLLAWAATDLDIQLNSVERLQTYGAWQDLPASTTVITIAHRASSLAWMDRVLVMDAGRLVEDGRPRDLLSDGAKGYYRAAIEKDGPKAIQAALQVAVEWDNKRNSAI
ncbi:ABC transporter, transmembrane domain, type 1 [Cordyceps fumosorosea ARSEF 2679]|uniref:ABC transporter, transmembrane domain, type 1 n=1 Tax=Cordyceps fumosorosea (strain ARSEF 2679) TaxID=1081104 RepID=A0A167YB04_CORFA|nr:ABC transporter, transmembrane domain, type 1 [Cordyceps fumosorosea ARSEF 2679]OAA66093.1 ABC transporter, transmembrane domain, type 1 [Cordyceps fumosorosea ARSEF 2679]